MSGDVHVQFCEQRWGKFLALTLRLLHCKTEGEAKEILTALAKRFAECGIEMHSEKTKIIYCRDDRRRVNYQNKSFDFLGYTFRPRIVKNRKENRIFTGFNPAASKQSCREIRQELRSYKIHIRSGSSLEEIAKEYNPKLRGWINYYGKYYISELAWTLQHFTKILVRWAMRKYKRYKRHKIKAINYIRSIAKNRPNLFAHWKIGII
jgi:RNA-directed DNA polymerase